MNTVIEIENLSKDYEKGFWVKKKIRALDDLTLNVESGQIFGFLGGNGAGKTTTIKILMSLIFPTEGNAKILGRGYFKRQDAGANRLLSRKSILLRLFESDRTDELFRRAFRLGRGDTKTKNRRIINESRSGRKRLESPASQILQRNVTARRNRAIAD